MRKLILATLCLTGIGAAAQAPALSIYSGAPDTIYTETTTLVAVTDPGASASVNGTDVHVYKTGSFGTRVALQPGANSVNVKVAKNGETTSKQLNIYRAPAKTKPAIDKEKALRAESTLMLADPYYVETKPGAYLQYGNGDDRLGGSKMGFVDAGIPMKVIGEKGSLLCVRLASSRIAYLPKEYATSTAQSTRVVNTGSWSITNTGKADVVTVSLPQRLAYQYATHIDPSTITIDLFGATDNSNWITQRSIDLGIIDFVDFDQVTEDVYRITIRLKSKYQWGFEVGYQGNSNVLGITVRHAPAKVELKGMVIGLDAGHGGIYNGAVSPSGVKEKDVNLDIVLRMKTLLEKQGAKVVLTRDGDTGPSMGERKRIWRENEVQLAVSVHNNAGGSALDSPGTAVLYKHQFDRPLSECMLRRMLGTGLPLFGLVGNFNFSLNGPTYYPNTLIEGMFMSSLAEEERVADPEFRQRVAEQLVAGLQDYLKLAK